MSYRLTQFRFCLRLALPATIFVALFGLAAAAHAQGCAQCRDNTAATPPSTQAAYRHAIVLLATTAGILFAGTVLLLKRHR